MKITRKMYIQKYREWQEFGETLKYLVKVFYFNLELAKFTMVWHRQRTKPTHKGSWAPVSPGRKNPAGIDDLVYLLMLLPRAYVWQSVTVEYDCHLFITLKTVYRELCSSCLPLCTFSCYQFTLLDPPDLVKFWSPPSVIHGLLFLSHDFVSSTNS